MKLNIYYILLYIATIILIILININTLKSERLIKNIKK